VIVVRVELHSAMTGKVTLLAKTIISNKRLRDMRGQRADYSVRVGRKGRLENQQVLRSPLRWGIVTDYPREALNVWRLVIRALLAAFPEEAPPKKKRRLVPKAHLD